jgi:hypothetical protein
VSTLQNYKITTFQKLDSAPVKGESRIQLLKHCDLKLYDSDEGKCLQNNFTQH